METFSNLTKYLKSESCHAVMFMQQLTMFRAVQSQKLRILNGNVKRKLDNDDNNDNDDNVDNVDDDGKLNHPGSFMTIDHLLS